MSSAGGYNDTTYRAYASEDVITGEGVAVELPVATVAHRIGSGLIDVIVMFIGLYLTLLVLGQIGAASEAVERAISILVLVFWFVGFPATVETLTRGRSLGKLALGLRVVRDDGGPITSRHAIVRALVGFIEIIMLTAAPAVIAAMIHPRSKRLGDMAAGTYAITQRMWLRMAPPPQMPPSLAEWAAGADIASLPSTLAIAIRQFLGRAGSLHPMARESVGRDLYAATLKYVSPQPPRGVHHEWVLAAVIADRRRRDLQRLWRDDQQRARLLPADPLA